MVCVYCAVWAECLWACVIYMKLRLERVNIHSQQWVTWWCDAVSFSKRFMVSVRNVQHHSSINTASHHRRPHCTKTPVCKHQIPITSLTSEKVCWSTTDGFVLGMARIIVMPPARAAAVPEAKSSLCVAPGSRTWTWTSMKPGNFTICLEVMQSVCVFIGGARPIDRSAC